MVYGVVPLFYLDATQMTEVAELSAYKHTKASRLTASPCTHAATC